TRRNEALTRENVSPSSRLQWSRRVHSAECRELSRASVVGTTASMEPPSSLGGMEETWSEIMRDVEGFNGAAEFTRRNAVEPTGDWYRVHPLQWSRRVHSAECSTRVRNASVTNGLQW